MIKLLIVEEYGYQFWYAELSEVEYEQLITRWETIRGLTCLVPVSLIIPQAKKVEEDYPEFTHRCHIHECDDSHLDGSNYKIPQDTHFWMNGRRYDVHEYF